MLDINFKVEGEEGLITHFKNFDKEMVNVLKSLAPATAQTMRSIIQANKKRPQAGEPTRLENAIDYGDIPGENVFGWYVGDMNRLEREAPWYLAVNFGSNHMVGKYVPLGAFSPGNPKPDPSSFRAGRWKGEGYIDYVTGESGLYCFKVKNPIPAMNYLQKTVDWLDSKIRNLKGIMSKYSR